MSRRAARRSRRGKGTEAAAPASAGASKGTPRFLSRKTVTPSQADLGGSAEREAKTAGAAGGALTERPDSTPLGRAGAAAVQADGDVGQPLPPEVRARMEQRLGASFDGVRIHKDSDLAEGFGANAVTHGDDIHFASGRYDPDTAEGDHLLGHELAHTAQQRRAGQPPVAQFDIPGQSLPSAMGVFEIDMQNATDPSGKVGLEGDIAFHPDPKGPYSTRIGLLQTASTASLLSTTLDPADQSGPPDPWTDTSEPDRDVIATTGKGEADPGWFTDVLTADLTPGQQAEPYYQEDHDPSVADNFGEYGHLRSDTDVKPATLEDSPGSTYDLDLDFETAAVGADNQVVYGVLRWGFEVSGGAVQREYAFAEDTQSVAFDEAVERFRGFYSHEPIVIYFDTDSAVPIAGEEAKLADVLQYMTDYPDAVIDLEGYADERRSSKYKSNSDLALHRAEAVRVLLESGGIATDRIEGLVPRSGTTEFGAGGTARRTAGNLKANRRVMIRFRRSASTQPVGP